MLEAMTRRIYPKPPIVEAIIEFHFDGTIEPSEFAAILGASLGDRYDAQIRQQDLFQLSASSQNGGISTSAQRFPHMQFLSSASGLRQLGCARTALSVHTLAPYPGWESFIEQAHEAVAALPEVVRIAPLKRIGVRYVDLIRLPPGEPISDFVTVVPDCPEGMPATLSNYSFATQSQDPNDGTFVQLIIASTPKHEDDVGSGLIYDLALSRYGEPLSSFEDQQWLSHVEQLHARLRHIFESSITDSTRELFQ